MTIMIMGISTVLVAAVPTYAQIGIWAPICLLLLRIIQGIGLGGEWGGAVLMTFEYAPPAKRGFYASIPQIGLALGLCLASGAVALLSRLLTDAQFMAWGWRIPFALSATLVIVGLWVRLHVCEGTVHRCLVRLSIFWNLCKWLYANHCRSVAEIWQW